MSYYMDIKGENELILSLNKSAQSLRPKLLEALNEIGRHVEDESKKKFGTYQRTWPKLKRASVIAKYHRRALGNGVKRPKLSGLAAFFGSGMGDDPLILHGDLKNSIKHEVNEGALETIIYSDDKKAAVHEYGYKNIPARSYLRLTLWDEEDKINSIVKNKVGDIFK